MKTSIDFCNASTLAPFCNRRAGENHVADVIHVPQTDDLVAALVNAQSKGITTVILGIPEDIGPRANCGLGGADRGWQAFLSVLLNQQANDTYDWTQCMLLGHVHVEDLLRNSLADNTLANLRTLCASLDKRVEPILKTIFDAGLDLVVIGGGHNNAYPILSALSHSNQSKVTCSNLDPHADFRQIEGRHSGNPFRYAKQDNILQHYHVFGLHEQKNNSQTISGLTEAGYSYTSYQSLFIRNDVEFEHAMKLVAIKHAASHLPSGVELDVDAIKYASASAYSVSGFSLEQAARYVYRMANVKNNRYVHICESAPNLGEENDAGQTIMQLVYSYLIAKQAQRITV
jgi:formiminoglutamase